jgi:glycosyltransferase involved in cell wall biosynthesis
LLKRARDSSLPLALLRARARQGLRKLEPDIVTVVVVAWNSEEFLPTVLDAANHFADRDIRLLVVDNHSDQSPAAITEQHGAKLVRLPANTGHSFALNFGFLIARTEFVLALDADAFPYRDSWLPTFVDPLSAGKTIVGCEWNGYAHPCCLAMRKRDFVRAKMSFAPIAEKGWDVGESMTRQLPADQVETVARIGPIPPTGAMLHAHFGDVVYHNGYSSRHLRFDDPEDAILDGVVSRRDALDAWDSAVARLGPPAWEGNGER